MKQRAKSGVFKSFRNVQQHQCSWTMWAKDEERGRFFRRCTVPGCKKKQTSAGVQR